jgi:hypothetical protein
MSLISPSTSLEKGCGGDEGGREEGGALLGLLLRGGAGPAPLPFWRDVESLLLLTGDTYNPVSVGDM